MKICIKDDPRELRNEFFNALFSKIYLDDSTNVDRFHNLLRKQDQRLKRMYNADLEKMNDNEYSAFVRNYYNITLDKDEYIDIYNETDNKEYNYYADFKTNTYTEIPIFTRNEGIHSPWVLDNAKISYEVLLDKKIPFDGNKEYSLEELDKLIQDRNIILLDVKYHVEDEIDNNHIYVDRIYPIQFLENCYNTDSRYFKVFINKMRLILTNKRKLEDLKNYLLSYKKAVNEFLGEMSYLDIQNKISKRALDLISSSQEYSDLEEMINRIPEKELIKK